MTDTASDRPASVRRVLADLHVDELHQQQNPPDRRVHVTLVPPTGGRLDVVRYAKNRKWWLEGEYREHRIRLPLTLQQAADIASCSDVESWAVWHSGVPGGEKLDRLVVNARMQEARKIMAEWRAKPAQEEREECSSEE